MSRKKVKLPDGNGGVRCPKCNCGDLRAESNWNVRLGRRRKRICRNCGHHVLTEERVSERVSQEDVIAPKTDDSEAESE